MKRLELQFLILFLSVFGFMTPSFADDPMEQTESLIEAQHPALQEAFRARLSLDENGLYEAREILEIALENEELSDFHLSSLRSYLADTLIEIASSNQSLSEIDAGLSMFFSIERVDPLDEFQAVLARSNWNARAAHYAMLRFEITGQRQDFDAGLDYVESAISEIHWRLAGDPNPIETRAALNELAASQFGEAEHIALAIADLEMLVSEYTLRRNEYLVDFYSSWVSELNARQSGRPKGAH